MNRETAMRARESMSVPISMKATPGAYLRGILGVNLGYDALSLHLVADHVEDHATRPDREPPIPCLSTVLPLLKIQILEYKNAILRSPFDKLLRSAVTEVFCSTRSLDFQPFEGSSNTSSIFSLCLSLSKLSLESFYCLRSTPVLNFSIQTAYEQLISISINSYNSIGFVEVDSDRMNSFNIRKFNRVGDITNELTTEILDYDTIEFSSIIKLFVERFRDNILKVLSTVDCGNAQNSIPHEVGISSSLSNKEKSKRSMPIERMIQCMSILLSRSISTGSQPNASASKLAGNSSFDNIINSSMQIKSFERFAKIPGSFGYAIAYLSEAIERIDEGFIILDNYLQGFLIKHQLEDTTIRINTLLIYGGV